MYEASFEEDVATDYMSTSPPRTILQLHDFSAEKPDLCQCGSGIIISILHYGFSQQYKEPKGIKKALVNFTRRDVLTCMCHCFRTIVERCLK